MNKRVIDQIKKRNKAFEKATPEHKRVLIAKDVIKQIRNNRIVPTTGRWVSPDTSHTKSDFASFQEQYFNRNIPQCECCALGAMMVSCVLYKNNATINNVAFATPTRYSDNPVIDLLNKYFDFNQQKLIEIAYERGEGKFAPEWEDEIAARYFGCDYKNDEDRMIAIMQNIIKNKGTFKPNE